MLEYIIVKVRSDPFSGAPLLGYPTTNRRLFARHRYFVAKV
jgi:hypothetical protein